MVGAIKSHAGLDATEEERAAARSNCAARARARGDEELALAFEHGTQDTGWAMRFEVNSLRAEKAAGE